MRGIVMSRPLPLRERERGEKKERGEREGKGRRDEQSDGMRGIDRKGKRHK
jgi:hypothetical protein